jgi:hypothetical protein
MERNQLINTAERRLWDAFLTGTGVDLGGGDPANPEFDPHTWDDERVVRGEVIERLLIGIADPPPGFIAKLELAGARISGTLNLSNGEIPYALVLRRCWLDSAPDFGYSHTKSMIITDSRLPGIRGHGWIADGSIDLSNNRFTQRVDLSGARISGTMAVGGFLSGLNGEAFSAGNLSVDENLYYSADTIGAIILYGAKIGGTFLLSGKWENPEGTAFSALNATIGGDMLFDETLVTGCFTLSNARIGGHLSLMRASLVNFTGNSLDADGLAVSGTAYFLAAFTGPVQLRRANLGQAEFSDVILDMRETVTSATEVGLCCESLTTSKLALPRELPVATDLRHAVVGNLSVSNSAMSSSMKIDGLTYTYLDGDRSQSPKEQLRWLRNDPDGYRPQPYEQLASYHRANGQIREARLVMLAKRRAQRAYENDRSELRTLQRTLLTLRKIPDVIFDILAGYGYAPGRALLWMLSASAVGTWVLSSRNLTEPTGNRTVNALLLTIDSIIPTSPFGLVKDADLTGIYYLTTFVLHALGYALSIAVLPALARAFSGADGTSR